MSTGTTPASTAREELAQFDGTLIGPADAEYGEACNVFNAMIRRPALIARCANPDDVVAAVGFARDHDLPLAIRGGGHNGAGLGTCDDGVVIDLSLMRDVEVDPEARTVRVGGGGTWGDVDRAIERARARDAQWDHLHDGGGWPHPGRRPRPSDPQMRACDRQPARSRRRSRKRRAGTRQRRRESRPLLGHPRRGRQLRRRHLLPVPAA